MEEIDLPVSIQEIGSGAFEGTGLRSVQLSENIKRLSADER